MFSWMDWWSFWIFLTLVWLVGGVLDLLSPDYRRIRTRHNLCALCDCVPETRRVFQWSQTPSLLLRLIPLCLSVRICFSLRTFHSLYQISCFYLMCWKRFVNFLCSTAPSFRLYSHRLCWCICYLHRSWKKGTYASRLLSFYPMWLLYGYQHIYIQNYILLRKRVQNSPHLY